MLTELVQKKEVVENLMHLLQWQQLQLMLRQRREQVSCSGLVVEVRMGNLLMHYYLQQASVSPQIHEFSALLSWTFAYSWVLIVDFPGDFVRLEKVSPQIYFLIWAAIGTLMMMMTQQVLMQ